MVNSFISIRNLTKRYGGHLALDHISVDIAEGEFLALLGPSGCGKTTLLRSIAGFIDIEEGDVCIDGNSMKHLPANRRPVNTVFQNYALFPHLSVLDNVSYGPRRAGKNKSDACNIAMDSLETVGMGSFFDRFPNQLSGGQQQRVALARAIANKPKVLLLDEPLGALDLKLRKRMQMELKSLQQRLGMTFVFVTHDQEEALVMADRIAVMDAGKIVQIGNGEEIYNAPNARYVADFIGDANLLDCVVAADGSLINAAANIKFHAEHDLMENTQVTYLLRPEVIQISDIDAPLKNDMLALPALVERIMFVGNATRIYARSKGQELVAQYPSSGQKHFYQPGQEVSFRWNRANGQVLTR